MPDEPTARQRVLEAAAATGSEQSSPTTAVVAATRHLESAPRFNAGVGSAVQSDGQIRTDAGLMTAGDTGAAAGAACAMPGVEHATEVARVVAAETPHVLVAGERAVALAESFDIETGCDLWTAATRERWATLDPPTGDAREHLSWVREQFGGTDTVGAAATDGETLAVATSTGGRWCALAGRVGDVPQVGAGFYATETAAASATGAGEAIARAGLARGAVERVESGLPPQLAADRAIDAFGREEPDAHAGVIVLDAGGQTGSAHGAPAMQTARAGRRS